MVGAGLLAWLLMGKFVDHLPSHRMAAMLHRQHGVEIPRNTIAGWVEQAADLLSPIYRAMRDGLRKRAYLQVDETPVRYLDPDGFCPRLSVVGTDQRNRRTCVQSDLVLAIPHGKSVYEPLRIPRSPGRRRGHTSSVSAPPDSPSSAHEATMNTRFQINLRRLPILAGAGMGLIWGGAIALLAASTIGNGYADFAIRVAVAVLFTLLGAGFGWLVHRAIIAARK